MTNDIEETLKLRNLSKEVQNHMRRLQIATMFSSESASYQETKAKIIEEMNITLTTLEGLE